MAAYTSEAVLADLELALGTLENDAPRFFRKIVRAVRTHSAQDLRHAVLVGAAPRLIELAGPASPERTRAFALELLHGLGVPPRELGALATGLPRTAWVREIELGAGWRVRTALPEAVLEERADAPPWPPLGVRPPVGLALAGSELVCLGADGGVRWRNATLLAGAQTSEVAWNARDDRVVVLAGKRVIVLDRGTGESIAEHAVAAGRVAVLLHDDGFLVWDGRAILGEPLVSGLVVPATGPVRDVIAPLVLATLVRPCGEIRLDFSRVDVLREGGGAGAPERLGFGYGIAEVGPALRDARGSWFVPIRRVPGGAPLVLAAARAGVRHPDPPRQRYGEPPAILDGIAVDAADVPAPERSILLAECSAHGPRIDHFVTWLCDLSGTFPNARIEVARRDDKDATPKVERATGGSIHYPSHDTEPSRPAREVDVDEDDDDDDDGDDDDVRVAWTWRRRTPAEVVADDVRGRPMPDGLPDPYLRFWRARDGWVKAWNDETSGGELMGLLGDPAFSPTAPRPVVRIAEAWRIRAYEMVRQATAYPPILEILAAIERENERVHWRVAGTWVHHPRGLEALAYAYAEVESPILLDRLRGPIGGLAEIHGRRDVLPRALEEGRQARAGGTAAPIAAQIDAALARAAGRAEVKRKPARVAEARAAAALALESSDLATLLAALDDEALDAPALENARAELWSTVLRVPRPTLRFARVLDALATETNTVAHAITYKLYLQKHLAADLGAALREVDGRDPRPAPLARRLAKAAAEWPDFPVSGA